MNKTAVIQVDNLSKVFRVNQKDRGVAGALKALVRPRHIDKVVVDGISFQVEPAEMVGYNGVNGAGKSTTIKILTGVRLPSGRPIAYQFWRLACGTTRAPGHSGRARIGSRMVDS